MLHDFVDCSTRRGLAAVCAVVYELDRVVELQELGQLVSQVDREPLEPRIALQLLLRLNQHRKRIILRREFKIKDPKSTNFLEFLVGHQDIYGYISGKE